ncbi:hypothetical protein PVAND_007401 [Polypedilum vanderplanki]|uniref:MD-2-related lipid-recognition domain-containing protein n=1 Tax=Polypedilum vanderplanki TaxID=319348 RepID=A0A9J6C731_POLVA|nr:hypothetical protein PVAND_007401 [Polypedilum vanderplanki]
MFKVAIVVLSLIYSINANFWTPCSDHPNAVAPRQIISAACPPGGTHCTATRGQVLEADAYVTPVTAHNYLRVTVTAYVLGIGIDLPPVDDDACNGMFLPDGSFHGCPTAPGIEHVWKINVDVNPNFPAFQKYSSSICTFGRWISGWMC